MTRFAGVFFSIKDTDDTLFQLVSSAVKTCIKKAISQQFSCNQYHLYYGTEPSITYLKMNLQNKNYLTWFNNKKAYMGQVKFYQDGLGRQLPQKKLLTKEKCVIQVFKNNCT